MRWNSWTTEGKLVLSMRHRPGSIYVDDYIYATGSEVNYRQWSFIDQVLTGHDRRPGG